jgi:hypothetical protein
VREKIGVAGAGAVEKVRVAAARGRETLANCRCREVRIT